MRSERIEAAIDVLFNHAREEGIAYAAGGCVRDLDAEKRTEAARTDLRTAISAAVLAEREACAALVRPRRFGTRECSCDNIAEDLIAEILSRPAPAAPPPAGEAT